MLHTPRRCYAARVNALVTILADPSSAFVVTLAFGAPPCGARGVTALRLGASAVRGCAPNTARTAGATLRRSPRADADRASNATRDRPLRHARAQPRAA